MILPFALSLAFGAGRLVGPCRPIVGKGTVLVDFSFAAGIFGGGTVGGTASVKGVFAGVKGGVGGRPREGFTSLSDLFTDSRDLRNMVVQLWPFLKQRKHDCKHYEKVRRRKRGRGA